VAVGVGAGKLESFGIWIFDDVSVLFAGEEGIGDEDLDRGRTTIHPYGRRTPLNPPKRAWREIGSGSGSLVFFGGHGSSGKDEI
jgi:hypothetical protein